MPINPKIVSKIKTNQNLTNLKDLYFILPFQFLNPESHRDLNQEFTIGYYFSFHILVPPASYRFIPHYILLCLRLERLKSSHDALHLILFPLTSNIF